MENSTISILQQISTTSTAHQTAANYASNVFFTWYDYAFCGTLLCISFGIGIYFGCCGKRQNSAKDYLMGGKQMGVIPVAISLVASHSSGITLLAVPSDVYVYGATYWLGAFSMMMLIGITVYIFLPVFYKLQLISTYEYLGLRFDTRVRKFSSILFGIAVFFYLPIVIYIPSLAFSAATGLNVHVVTTIVCAVCIFYTTIGGMKALVWTDTLQFTLTMVIICTVVGLGVSSIGGVSETFKQAVGSGRLDILDFDVDPTKRESFWTIIIGLTVHWTAHTAVNQGCTQKFLAVPTLSDSKKTVFFYCMGMVLVKSASVINGLIMAVKYAHCDPLKSGKIERNDQLLPYYVMDIGSHIPGLAGLFMAGIFSASLSALSGNLNSLAGTIYEDFLKKFWTRKTNRDAGFLLKILVLTIGVISTCLVYVVEHLGGILSLSIGLGSVAHGPVLGMFILGMLIPKANAKGAFYGALTSMFCMATIIFGCHYYQAKGLIKYPRKPVYLDECPLFNSTLPIHNATSPVQPDIYVFPIFKISFYYYTLIGAVICIIVGCLVSYLVKDEQSPVAKELLSPIIYRFLPEGVHPEEANIEYDGVEEALKRVTNASDVKTENAFNNLERRKSLRLERLRKVSVISDIIDN